MGMYGKKSGKGRKKANLDDFEPNLVPSKREENQVKTKRKPSKKKPSRQKF